jgi:hypothetical protein
VYQDWRELLKREHGNIDSVSVSTPDHMHAKIGMEVMRLMIKNGKLKEVQRLVDISFWRNCTMPRAATPRKFRCFARRLPSVSRRTGGRASVPV